MDLNYEQCELSNALNPSIVLFEIICFQVFIFSHSKYTLSRRHYIVFIFVSFIIIISTRSILFQYISPAPLSRFSHCLLQWILSIFCIKTVSDSNRLQYCQIQSHIYVKCFTFLQCLFTLCNTLYIALLGWSGNSCNIFALMQSILICVDICIYFVLNYTLYNSDIDAELMQPLIPMYHHQYPQFCIDTKYHPSASVIYQILSASEIPGIPQCSAHFFAVIVAEYGATQHVPCTECNKLFALIECTRDFEYIDGGMALYNEEKGEIMYYLNYQIVEQEEIIAHENEEDCYDEILCYECGVKYRCSVCSMQGFEFNEEEFLIPGGCYFCKGNICDYCSVYIDAKKIGICENCFRDKSINTEFKLQPIDPKKNFVDIAHWTYWEQVKTNRLA